MERRDTSQQSEDIDANTARRLFKAAEREANKNRGLKSNFFSRIIGRRLYKLGVHELAHKIAPPETAILAHQEARILFEKAKSNKTKKIEYHEPILQKPIREMAPLQTTKPEYSPQIDTELDKISDEFDTIPEKGLNDQEENIINWKEWYNLTDEKSTGHEKTEEQAFRYFNEKERDVGLIKKAQFGYIVVPQTNETIADFVKENAKRIGGNSYKQILVDLQKIIKHIIDYPVGPHSKRMKGQSIALDGVNHGLYRSDPRKIPHGKFTHSNSKTIRIIYFQNHGSIILNEILLHEEMVRTYSNKHSD